MGTNKIKAIKSFERLELSLSKNHELSTAYSNCLTEYVTLDHMSPCSEELSYLLPHHAVIKESSSTTKVRVVFDCSSKDNFGLSLNDRLYKGPSFLSDISSLLMNFRNFPVCLVADIKMMYRAVLIHPSDRKHVALLWRDQNDQTKRQIYHMNRVTFGMKPSGFLVAKSLLVLAHLYKNEYPNAANAILHHRYADDFCVGSFSISSASSLQKEMCDLLAKGGFEIRKWSSNCPEVLANVPSDHKETPVTLPSGEVGVKVLGVMWEQSSDSFVVRVLPFESICVKRQILSYISKIFDVMGLFSPTIFLAKYFMQKLWLINVGWDDPLPSEFVNEWKNYVIDLQSLSDIKVPRYIPINTKTARLVGFSDASEKGMCAVAFVSVTSDHEDAKSYLLKAKTKLAPLKTLTIPRLELCAALLLAELIKSIIGGSTIKFSSIDLYCDSKIVLSWLECPLFELNIFVSNRVSQIQSLVPSIPFHFIRGSENPADLGSRGIFASQLKKSEIWWQGPKFLREPYEDWPHGCQKINKDELPEMKNSIISLSVEKRDVLPKKDEILLKFSSLTRMKRVLAYVRRFINNCRTQNDRTNNKELSTQELNDAMNIAVSLSQKEYFSEAFIKLKIGKPVDKQLQKLNPFIHEETQLIRVGGRLKRALFLSFDARHPLLLPKQSHLSTLICDHYHKLLLHSGPRTTIANIQKKYWILSLTSLVKKIIHRCTKCVRFNGKPQQPIMADVIPHRMEQSFCWANCAIDFGGPFLVKESNLRKSTLHKSYICVFVCLTSKATHLEMVTDLTASAFHASLLRFCSRRSVPGVIYSDRGSNFCAVRTRLCEWRKFLIDNHDEIFSAAASIGTKWMLNVPYGPNFNSCAENGIKSAKSLLKKQVGDQILTFEEFSTLLCRVEQVLNSRPISFVPTDISDQDVLFLTPAHLILGREMMAPVEEHLDETVTFYDRWKRVRQLAQVFWKKWSTAYLHELMQRNKWTKATENLQPGALVYVTGIGTSPLSWPLGVVEEVYPGSGDSTIRVVRIRSRGRSITRPVSKLIVIPTN